MRKSLRVLAHIATGVVVTGVVFAAIPQLMGICLLAVVCTAGILLVPLLALVYALGWIVSEVFLFPLLRSAGIGGDSLARESKATDPIAEFILRAREHRWPDAAIRASLHEAGWQRVEIDRAFATL